MSLLLTYPAFVVEGKLAALFYVKLLEFNLNYFAYG
jgi:hypothetical protein